MLTLIFGKPGCGKSYYAVERIAQQLVDFVETEMREGTAPRRIYTNLLLNVDALCDYVSTRVFKRVDVSDYIVYLDSDFFLGPHKSPHFHWWEQFEEGAYIVIDEVHHYLGADADRDDREYLVAWRNYISTHRHRKHDLTLITQHTDNIQRSVLCMAENAYHIVNIKSKVLPFVGIPFADLDVVKEAWGIKHQYIQILYGCYIGRVFKHESVFRELLKPEIYALYQSHTLTEGNEAPSDRPSLHLSRLGSLWWLFRRHALQLGLKAVGVYIVVSVVIGTFKALPGAISSGFTQVQSTEVDKPSEPEHKESGQGTQEVRSVQEVPRVVVPDEKILVILPGAIVTDHGRRAVGDVVQYQGKPQKLEGTDVVQGIVSFKPIVPVSAVPVVAGDGVQSSEDQRADITGGTLSNERGGGTDVEN